MQRWVSIRQVTPPRKAAIRTESTFSPCQMNLQPLILDVKILISNLRGGVSDDLPDCRVCPASRGDAGLEPGEAANDAAACRADPSPLRLPVQGPSSPGPGRVGRGAARPVR